MIKKTIYFFTALLFITACGPDEPENLELSNPEAFAFYLDNAWELNTSVNVKGFSQKETEDDLYGVLLDYRINLVTPDSTLVSNANRGTIDRTQEEEIMDLQIEAQIVIDSSFSPGRYRIEYIVQDKIGNKEAAIDTTFELTKY